MAALLGLPLLMACEVEWGGGRLALEDPAQVEDPEERPEPETRVAALPEGPMLYVVRTRPDGRAWAVPAARVRDGLETLELPGRLPEAWRARFDSAFLAPGTELPLQFNGERIGTLVLDEGPALADPDCPSVASGRVLVLPGQEVPRLVFALPRDVAPSSLRRVTLPQPDRRMAVAGPVLAERLIEDPRAYLARRVALRVVLLPGEDVPAMSGTWLVGDTIAPGPPPGPAISLYFLARFEPARGYIPIWSEVRRYDGAEEKEAFVHLDWIRVPEGRLHLLWRVDGGSEGLAAAYLLEETGQGSAPKLTWTEGERCRALPLLDRAEAATASGGQ